MRDWIRTADRLPEPHVSVSAHSPAPYRPRDPLHHAELFVAKTDDLRGMESIAEVGPAMRDDEALANACLFEVAPEMLDLLEHWMGLVDGGPMGITSATEHLDRIHATARAILAKYENNVREGTEAWERMMAGGPE